MVAWQWATSLVFQRAHFLPGFLGKVEFQWNCFLILLQRLCHQDFANAWAGRSRHPLIHHSFILPALQHPKLLSFWPSFGLVATSNLIHVNLDQLEFRILWQTDSLGLRSFPSWHARLLWCGLLTLIHLLDGRRWCFQLVGGLLNAIQIRHARGCQRGLRLKPRRRVSNSQVIMMHIRLCTGSLVKQKLTLADVGGLLVLFLVWDVGQWALGL
mmetsp:Transcript_108585/g.132514  ORF Transcript_108585/g.132514 Transcript_108585/m.132514 type:complete len:213 (+) Transcript_108585:690-1328(+)